jgi:hypothetical protein
MGTTVARGLRAFGGLLEKAGPYLLIEFLLPGGSLIALVLFLYQRSRQSGAVDATQLGMIDEAIVRLHDRLVSLADSDGIAMLWRGRHRERAGLEALAMTPGH